MNNKISYIDYMKFYYGDGDIFTDITESINKKSRINKYIVIPVTDIARSCIHGDPLPGVNRSPIVNR